MPDLATRFWVAGILAGLAAIAAVAFIVLGPGRFDPSPPSLSGDPIPGLHGSIAYLDNQGCIYIVEGSTGATTKIRCDTNFPSGLTFINADTVGYFVYAGGQYPTWWAIDIGTGNATNLGSYPDPGSNYDHTLGGRIFVAEDGELFVEDNGTRRSIYSASFPEYYTPQPLTLSPDGNWLLVTYSAPRGNGPEVWVIALDGSGARTITRHANWDMRSVSWWMDGDGAAPEMAHPDLPVARAR